MRLIRVAKPCYSMKVDFAKIVIAWLVYHYYFYRFQMLFQRAEFTDAESCYLYQVFLTYKAN